jgi:hypothetical protein
MRRKHGAGGKSVPDSRIKVVSPGQAIRIVNTNHVRPLFNSPYYDDRFAQDSMHQMEGPHFDPNDLMRGTVEWKTMIDFKKNVEIIFGLTKPSYNFPRSPLHFGLTDLSAAPYMDPEARIPFGFRIRLCRVCLKNIPVTIQFDREISWHTCSPGVNWNPTKKDNYEIIKKLCDNAGDLLFHTVSTFQNSKFDVLHADTLSGNSLAARRIIAPNPLKPEQEISIFSENEKKIDLDLDAILHENNGILTNTG